MFSPIMRSQGKYILSATKAIIDPQKAVKRYYNYSKRIIEKTTIRVHYTTKTMPNITVTSMNCLKAGFH